MNLLDTFEVVIWTVKKMRYELMISNSPRDKPLQCTCKIPMCIYVGSKPSTTS